MSVCVGMKKNKIAAMNYDVIYLKKKKYKPSKCNLR